MLPPPPPPPLAEPRSPLSLIYELPACSVVSSPRTRNSNHPKPPQAPLILLASWTSFCMMVTRLAWMAHRFVSSNRWTMKASQLSCRAWMACDCQRNDSPPVGTSERAISRTCALRRDSGLAKAAESADGKERAQQELRTYEARKREFEE